MKRLPPTAPPAVEFSRRIVVRDLPPEGGWHELVATAAERAALARRLGVMALDQLVATVEVRPLGDGLVRVAARLRATLTQECVVTLEPVVDRIEDTFAVLYGPAAAAAGATGEVVVSPEPEVGPPEPIEHGEIDLGEAVAQQLALAIDPYPRAPGASAEALSAYLEPPSGGAARRDGPFDALAKLKSRG
jgi:uncharacterized metal-binding protein YceD (DUF177 family)